MNDSHTLLQEGLAAFRARAYDEALRAWRELLSIEPDHPHVRELVSRTEALAAEGQLVNQLREELADLRQELATTRESRNDLLLEMARVHKRYEEREARLWRAQEAREWELREALAEAELRVIQGHGPAPVSNDARDLDALVDAIAPTDAQANEQSVSPHDADTQNARANEEAANDDNPQLRQAHMQIQTLRQELARAHQRIVELETALEHPDDEPAFDDGADDNPLLYALLHEDDDETSDENVPDDRAFDELDLLANLRNDNDENHDYVSAGELPAAPPRHHEPEADENGFVAPAAFLVVESQQIDAEQDINEDPLFGQLDTTPIAEEPVRESVRTATQTTDIRREPTGRAELAWMDTDAHDEAEPLFSDEFLYGNDEEPTPDTLVTLLSAPQQLPVTNGDPSPSARIAEALLLDEQAHQARAQHVDSSNVNAASGDAASVDAASVDAASVDAASVDAASVDAASVDAASVDAASVDAASGDAASGDAASGDAASGDAASGDAASGDAHTDDENDPSYEPLVDLDALDDSAREETFSDESSNHHKNTAEYSQDTYTAERLHDDGVDELTLSLDHTPDPPRIDTGAHIALPELEWEVDPQALSVEEFERRSHWIPVIHGTPKVSDAIATYLLTHIDGVSTFMELRGTVGIPPAAVDNAFRVLIEADAIRARPQN